MSKDLHTLYLEAVEQEKSLRETLIASGEREERLAQLARGIEERYNKPPSSADIDAFKRILAASETEAQPQPQPQPQPQAQPQPQPSSAVLRPPQNATPRHPGPATASSSATGSRSWTGREAAVVGVKRGK